MKCKEGQATSPGPPSYSCPFVFIRGPFGIPESSAGAIHWWHATRLHRSGRDGREFCAGAAEAGGDRGGRAGAVAGDGVGDAAAQRRITAERVGGGEGRGAGDA